MNRLFSLKEKPLPRHIAIIMDGNGRWARKRGLPRLFGHRAGVKSVKETVKSCGELGIEALTLYAFSAENWSRPKAEVGALMGLLSKMLSTEVDELDASGVRLMTVGRTRELPQKVQDELGKAIERLGSNQGLVLNLALNYGGRQEIVDAVNEVLKSGVKKVDEKSFARRLYTAGLPDPDLMIRTSGEMRISNFLLYQLAYAELYVTPVLWPDFRRAHLHEAIAAFQARERRFGGT